MDEPDLGSQDSVKEKFDKWNESSDALVALHSESAMILDSKESLQLAAKQNIDVSTPKIYNFSLVKVGLQKHWIRLVFLPNMQESKLNLVKVM